MRKCWFFRMVGEAWGGVEKGLDAILGCVILLGVKKEPKEYFLTA